jgi:hypothetical protein
LPRAYLARDIIASRCTARGAQQQNASVGDGRAANNRGRRVRQHGIRHQSAWQAAAASSSGIEAK